MPERYLAARRRERCCAVGDILARSELKFLGIVLLLCKGRFTLMFRLFPSLPRQLP